MNRGYLAGLLVSVIVLIVVVIVALQPKKKALLKMKAPAPETPPAPPVRKGPPGVLKEVKEQIVYLDTGNNPNGGVLASFDRVVLRPNQRSLFQIQPTVSNPKLFFLNSLDVDPGYLNVAANGLHLDLSHKTDTVYTIGPEGQLVGANAAGMHMFTVLQGPAQTILSNQYKNGAVAGRIYVFPRPPPNGMTVPS